MLCRGGFAGLALAAVSFATGSVEMAQRRADWTTAFLAFPYASKQTPQGPMFMLLRQDFERLERNRSILGTRLRIGTQSFATGLGTHANSHIRITSPTPIVAISGWIGVDANERTRNGMGSVVFVIRSRERGLYRSPVLRGGGEPQRLEVETGSARTLDLVVEDAGDGPTCDHADWADVRLRLSDGSERPLGELPEGAADLSGPYPFSFRIGGRDAADVLGSVPCEEREEAADRQVRRLWRVWSLPDLSIKVTFEATEYRDFGAVDWLLWFENTGDRETPLVEDVMPLDWTLEAPASEGAPYVLHRTKGGTPTPDQFEATTHDIGGAQLAELGSGAGRSSTRDFPFFKVELGDGALIAAVGWSGTWKATVEAPNRRQLHLAAGIEHTRFVLRPGERIRTPRILLMRHRGHTLDANARFRELLYAHYLPRRFGKPPRPLLFSNTCFTRGGGWLNECNAENQISLINAYGPLGLEAVITDAGWFEGGWPDGVGNWTPRKDAYPNGMGPVAAAAQKHGMVYGLWFEPERVVAGTALHREHPEWCLADGPGPRGTYLANFALPEVREHFLGLLRQFMNLPGFGVYRQDFNMDPLPYWRFNDAPDRQGMTEMLYIQGLYAFWDAIASTWPDSIREECASGGHRMDLETVRRFHIHQKTDYWFDNTVDQASIWSLSQYLPNCAFVAPINRLDEFTLYSVMATSLCVGWIADAPEFPAARAQKLLSRYLALRHFFVGAYYPLTGYSRSPRDWMAYQFHRKDLDAGVILVFRREQSPYQSLEVSLRGLDPKASYTIRSEMSGKVTTMSGSALANRLIIALPEPRSADVLVYRKAAR